MKAIGVNYVVSSKKRSNFSKTYGMYRDIQNFRSRRVNGSALAVKGVRYRSKNDKTITLG